MIYERILLPVSGKFKGERAQKALVHALKLTSAELVLLHAYQPLPKIVGGEAHTALVAEATSNSLTLLSTIINQVQQAGLPYKIRIVEGAPAEAIIHIADEEKCDLIVMYTDGRDDLADMLMGSVTERVLRNTDVPLLAIRR
ncbi:MAG: universal stress protein [Desulfovibrionaceae bacterium]